MGDQTDDDSTDGSTDRGSDLSEESHTVELVWAGGPTERVRVADGQTVVEAADAAGVGVPYGCLYGACGTCTAELLAGDLRHSDAPRALKQRALDAGYVLPCIGVPESDCRLRVGHDIQAEVVGVPWK